MPRRRFYVRQQTVTDVDRQIELTQKMKEMLKEKTRVSSRYLQHCRVNREEVWSSSSLTSFLGSIRAQLSDASAKRTAEVLQVIRRETKQDPVDRLLRMAKKVYSLEVSARRIVAQSADFQNVHDAVRLVQSMMHDVKIHGEAASAMLFLGPRCADLQWFRGGRDSDSFFSDKVGESIRLEIRRAKNVRTAKDRRKLQLNKPQLKFMPKEIWHLLKNCLQRIEPFVGLDYDKFKTDVQLHANLLGIRSRDGRQFTPGSLRRCFVQVRLAEATKRGVCNYEEAMRYTGHKDVRTLKAYYDFEVANEVAHSFLRKRTRQ